MMRPPRDYACDEMCAAEGLLMLADRPRLILHVCNVCGASFDSHQALGGHMTCHRPKSTSSSAVAVSHEGHNCSICNRRFPSGQALGGHKRKHYQGSAIGCGRPAGNDKFSSGDSGGGPHQDRIRLDIDLKSCRTPSNNGLSNH